jgi:hypothetical protein
MKMYNRPISCHHWPLALPAGGSHHPSPALSSPVRLAGTAQDPALKGKAYETP